MRKWVGAFLVVSYCALSACGFRDDYEEPRYEVLQQQDNIELRNYAPMLLAEVTIADADRSDAASAAFRILFDYISGANVPNTKVDMTVPVTQIPEGQEIAMTVPVTQTPKAKGWRVSFRLPNAFTLQNVPKPTDARITIYETTPEMMAVIQFSGFWSDSNIDKQKATLLNYLEGIGYEDRNDMETFNE